MNQLPVFNANDPVDLSVLLIMGMVEFFTARMEPAIAQKHFGDFMAGVAADLCSDKGQKYLEKGRDKYQKLIEDANGSARN
jgi:hypothetical protein